MAAAAFAYRTNKNSSSDSDSDDSDQDCRDWKRATRKKGSPLEKIPIDPPPTATPVKTEPEDKAATSKRKRNNIWCEVLEDQILSESLDHCGVKQKPKGYGSRGEESYDYTLARKFHKKEEDSDGELSEEDMSDSTETSSVTSSVRERKFNRKNFVQLDSTSLEAAKKIVKTLGEQKHHLICKALFSYLPIFDILKFTSFLIKALLAFGYLKTIEIKSFLGKSKICKFDLRWNIFNLLFYMFRCFHL